MTKQQTARIVTLGVLAGVAAIVLGRKLKTREEPMVDPIMQPSGNPVPQNTIYAMLDAAKAGDTEKYMSCYTGQMLSSLQQSVNETGKEGFAKYLKDSNAPIKGIALNEPQILNDREVKVRVEFVYEDRNEAQTMYFEQTGAGWKIARVDGSERVKTLIPYGTPVQ